MVQSCLIVSSWFGGVTGLQWKNRTNKPPRCWERSVRPCSKWELAPSWHLSNLCVLWGWLLRAMGSIIQRICSVSIRCGCSECWSPVLPLTAGSLLGLNSPFPLLQVVLFGWLRLCCSKAQGCWDQLYAALVTSGVFWVCFSSSWELTDVQRALSQHRL